MSPTAEESAGARGPSALGEGETSKKGAKIRACQRIKNIRCSATQMLTKLRGRERRKRKRRHGFRGEFACRRKAVVLSASNAEQLHVQISYTAVHHLSIYPHGTLQLRSWRTQARTPPFPTMSALHRPPSRVQSATSQTPKNALEDASVGLRYPRERRCRPLECHVGAKGR